MPDHRKCLSYRTRSTATGEPVGFVDFVIGTDFHDSLTDAERQFLVRLAKECHRQFELIEILPQIVRRGKLDRAIM